jgi:hypothetical protein
MDNIAVHISLIALFGTTAIISSIGILTEEDLSILCWRPDGIGEIDHPIKCMLITEFYFWYLTNRYYFRLPDIVRRIVDEAHQKSARMINKLLIMILLKPPTDYSLIAESIHNKEIELTDKYDFIRMPMRRLELKGSISEQFSQLKDHIENPDLKSICDLYSSVAKEVDKK